jgi:hypothetical protein
MVIDPLHHDAIETLHEVAFGSSRLTAAQAKLLVTLIEHLEANQQQPRKPGEPYPSTVGEFDPKKQERAVKMYRKWWWSATWPTDCLLSDCPILVRDIQPSKEEQERQKKIQALAEHIWGVHADAHEFAKDILEFLDGLEKS